MTLTKRQRRKAVRRLGVPHYEEGGFIPDFSFFGGGNSPPPPPPDGDGITYVTGPGGRIFVIDQYGDVVDSYQPSTTGGGGGTDPAYLALQADQNRINEMLGLLNAEIDREQLAAQAAIANNDLVEERLHNRNLEQLEQQRIGFEVQRDNLDRQVAQYRAELEKYGIDVSQLGNEQDYNLGLINAQSGLWGQALQDAIARGGLALEGRGQDIEQRSQDLQGQIAFNNNLIDTYATQVQEANNTGDYQLAAAAEERLRVAQQQGVMLEGYRAELAGAELGGTMQQGAGGLLSGLAQQEADRQERLQELASNPRDFIQYLNATQPGGSGPFYEALARGESFVPGGTYDGDSLLGEGFDALVARLNETPTYDAAVAAAQRLQDMAGNVPTAPTREELLAYGDNLAPLGPPPSPVTPPALTLPTAESVAPAVIPDAPPSPYAYTIPTATQQTQANLEAQFGPATVTPGTTTYAGHTPTAADLIRAAQSGTALLGTPNYGALPGAPAPISGPVPPFAEGGNVYSNILARWRKLTGKKPMGKGHLVLDEPAVLMGEFSGRPLATMGENAPRENEMISQMPGGGWNVQPMRR